MKSCDQYQEESALYALGDLESASQADFETHLADCPSCQAEVKAQRQLLGELRSDIPADPGDLFFQRQLKSVMNALPSKVSKRTTPFWLPALAAAALFLLVFGLGRYQERQAAVQAQNWRSALQVIATEHDTPWGDEDLDEFNDRELDSISNEIQQKLLGNHPESWFEDSGDWDNLDDQQIQELKHRMQTSSLGRQT